MERLLRLVGDPRRRQVLIHALLLTACFLALSRPHRVWLAADPALASAGAMKALSALGPPAFPTLDARVGVSATERIYSLRGYRHAAAEMESGDSVGKVLLAAGASPTEAASLSQTLRRTFDPRRVRVGQTYDVLVDSAGHIEEFTYRASPLEIYRAVPTDSGWNVTRVEVPVETRETALVGQLSGSLYESFVASGADPELAMEFVDLFRWDVDFAKEAQPGDEFRLVYEELFAQGEPAGHGKILAASYRDAEEEHVAIYYRSKLIEGYFDPAGKSVKKSFLRSPLKFSHISSRYTLARRHPILDVVRPHRAVDYAAPLGTPVWAVADGRVAEMGWKGGAGRSVALRHAQGYESYYHHLLKFPRGLKIGSSVRQGQVVGYVGSTGLSTGPHLDFRVKKNGTWVDPLREKYLAGAPIPSGEGTAYRRWAKTWQDRLQTLTQGVTTVAQR